MRNGSLRKAKQKPKAKQLYVSIFVLEEGQLRLILTREGGAGSIVLTVVQSECYLCGLVSLQMLFTLVNGSDDLRSQLLTVKRKFSPVATF